MYVYMYVKKKPLFPKKTKIGFLFFFSSLGINLLRCSLTHSLSTLGISPAGPFAPAAGGIIFIIITAPPSTSHSPATEICIVDVKVVLLDAGRVFVIVLLLIFVVIILFVVFFLVCFCFGFCFGYLLHLLRRPRALHQILASPSPPTPQAVRRRPPGPFRLPSRAAFP